MVNEYFGPFLYSFFIFYSSKIIRNPPPRNCFIFFQGVKHELSQQYLKALTKELSEPQDTGHLNQSLNFSLNMSLLTTVLSKTAIQTVVSSVNKEVEDQQICKKDEALE